MSDNFDFGANFGQKVKKLHARFSIKPEVTDRFFLIFNRKHGVLLGYIVFIFEQNQIKNMAVRVPHTKNAKWPPWRHQIEISKI